MIRIDSDKDIGFTIGNFFIQKLKAWHIAIKKDGIQLKSGQVVRAKNFLPKDVVHGSEQKDAAGNVIVFYSIFYILNQFVRIYIIFLF